MRPLPSKVTVQCNIAAALMAIKDAGRKLTMR